METLRFICNKKRHLSS